MLRCGRCKEVKDESYFARHANTKTGYSDRCKECRKAYNNRNKEKNNAYARQYYYDNQEKLQAISRRWIQSNWDRVLELHNIAWHKQRVEGPTEDITMKVLYQRDKTVCQICSMYCSPEEATIDHIVPVSAGGRHTWDNVQLAHRGCNTRKGNKQGV